MNSLPSRAEVIVVGGGIVGASIAYHLTARGVTDVVVLERHQLTSGTTWHAAGLVAQLRATENQTKLARYSHQLYQRLSEETEQNTGFRDPGAISLASTAARWEEIRRTAAMARRLGIEAREISPDEIAKRWPICDVSDLLGGVLVPGEAVVGPADTTVALTKGARSGGATIFEGVEVTDVLTERSSGGRRAVGVTARPAGSETTTTIEADSVVLACGMWTRHLAARAGVVVPLMGAEHHYVVTEPVDGVDIDLPILRDPDRWAYLKPEAGGSMLVGLFEPVGRPWPAEGPPPADRPFITLDPDPEHLATWLEPAFDRIPALHDVGIRLLFDGPESFTPDDAYILGEAPSLERLFVAAGFNSIGIQSAGGVGMAIAHWITEGRPPFDLHDVDIRRFESWQADDDYLRARTVEVLGLLYANHWPHRTFETARGVIRSPVHDRLDRAGACFADLNGWDRPMFYAKPELGVEAEHHYAWRRQYWHEASAIEHRAVRERVGVFDLTSFAKFEVSGPDAAIVLDHLSAGRVDGPVGRSVYTQWLNHQGGIEADLTISRLGEEQFWVIGGAATHTRDLTALQRSVAGRRATVTDLTYDLACLAVMGPLSRSLLQPLFDTDLSDGAFPFATNAPTVCATAHGLVDLIANRMSYVGELGWELYVSNEHAGPVLDALAAAAEGELTRCGYHALNSLRIEKGYRHWGHDITPDDTPVEAGLGFAVAWDKDADFVGRTAIEGQRAEGATRRLVQVALVQDQQRSASADAHHLHHAEPLRRDGETVGYVTSGMWGHTVDAALGMGLASRGEPVTADWVRNGHWEVELPGGRFPARVQLGPWLK